MIHTIANRLVGAFAAFAELQVPPAVIRPSVDVEGGASNEDDITMKLMVRLKSEQCKLMWTWWFLG